MTSKVIEFTPAKRERNRKSLGRPGKIYNFPGARRNTAIVPWSPSAASLTRGAPSRVDYGFTPESGPEVRQCDSEVFVFIICRGKKYYLDIHHQATGASEEVRLVRLTAVFSLVNMMRCSWRGPVVVYNRTELPDRDFGFEHEELIPLPPV